MAIAKHNTEHSHCSVAAKTIPDDYKTLTVSDRERDIKLQVACTEGSPWKVEYYRQRLGDDQETRFGDSDLSPSYQTYTRIQKLTIRVLEGLEPSVDDGINVSTGAAIVYSFTPVIGDLFIAKVYGGEHYIFDVTSVTPLTFLATTAYRIEYMIHCVAEGSVLLQTLTDKTYDTVVYNESTGNCGNLLKPSVSEDIDKLNILRDKLMNEYFRLFLDADTDLLILEDEYIKLYDDRLNRFIYHTWPLMKTKLGRRIRGVADVESEDNWLTIWDLLLDGEDTFFEYEPVIPPINANRYRYGNTQFNLYSHRIDYFMSGDKNFDSTDTVNSIFGITDIITPTIDIDGVDIDIYPTIADSYVVSSGWYNDVDNSVLELYIRKLINKESIPTDSILEIINSWKKWPLVNKFFQTPLLMLLINYILDSPELPITGGKVNCRSLA